MSDLEGSVLIIRQMGKSGARRTFSTASHSAAYSALRTSPPPTPRYPLGPLKSGILQLGQVYPSSLPAILPGIGIFSDHV